MTAFPVEVEVENQQGHTVGIEHEWLDMEGVTMVGPEDSNARLRVTVTLLDGCPSGLPREHVEALAQSWSDAAFYANAGFEGVFLRCRSELLAMLGNES